MNNPLIITCAITGAETSKDTQPALPISPKEQAAAAAEAFKAGARIIHLHVRDDQGKPTQDIARFREAVSAIRKTTPELLIEITTGGAVGDSLNSRLAPLADCRPDLASLNMGSLNFGDEVFSNSIPTIETILASIQSAGARPTMEVYDLGMLEWTLRRVQKFVSKPPPVLNLVLGAGSGASGSFHNLAMLSSRIPHDQPWGSAGIGRFQLPVAIHTMLAGGHVRVGLEDNIFYHKGELATSNAQLVSRISRIAAEIGRPLATPEQTRQLLGLN